MAEIVNVRLSVEAAMIIRFWLETVPIEAVPVVHPAERQALTDLLSELEQSGPTPNDSELVAARKEVLKDAGDWVHLGATYLPPK